VGPDLLLHLDLLLPPLLGIQLRAQASEVLGFLGGFMALTGDALSGALIMVETGCSLEGAIWRGV
jgi:hypothetical protein